MRTTLNLDDGLMREAKAVAARTGQTLTAVIEDALRESFGRRRERRPRGTSALPTFGVGGLQAGIDLDDSAALLEAMESRG